MKAISAILANQMSIIYNAKLFEIVNSELGTDNNTLVQFDFNDFKRELSTLERQFKAIGFEVGKMRVWLGIYPNDYEEISLRGTLTMIISFSVKGLLNETGDEVDYQYLVLNHGSAIPPIPRVFPIDGLTNDFIL